MMRVQFVGIHVFQRVSTIFSNYDVFSVVIDIVAPLPAGGFGGVETAYAVVDVGFVGLAQLVAPAHIVHPAVLDKACAGLVEAEGNPLLHALPTEVEYPVVMAWTCLAA